MALNEKAVFLIEEILKNETKLEKAVFNCYVEKDYSLREGFEQIAKSLKTETVEKSARTERNSAHDERFGSTIGASHLIERGFVDGHENYEYEWYLHIDYEQKKEEYVELFINRVHLATVSLALMIKDYVDRTNKEEQILMDPVDLVEQMGNEVYREQLSQILTDSDQRIQAIIDKKPSPEHGVLCHDYVSELYGGVSKRELINYALKISVAADDYALIALDQQVEAVMKLLADKNQEKEMDILLGLGYLLDFYGIDFEQNQTSYLMS